ncbi:MAG: anti-sigma F factor [Clostridia bacterium]|nr:anti-sigma F factor [Clostridia bacterium]MBR6650323.1 anti-sigma F factor [Clostridia bacterium]
MKKRENILETKFPSLSRNESLARSLVSAFIMQSDPTVSELSDIKCAVSEAVTNSIVHGYKEQSGTIYMRIESSSDRIIKIEIRDKGCGIENIETAMQPLYTSDPEGERSGMGFTVMETFCDKVRVVSKKGKGTKVVLIKKLSPKEL